MNPDRKKDIEIFNAALEIESPEKRVQYLKEACAGDPERRQRIEALLQAYEESDSVFSADSETAPSSGLETQPLSEGPGMVIGSYKLLQKIGEGGMGVVYMADQEEPVQRKVALKIIKIGMDTRRVVARFEAERQALALMDHPNIARVFDGGSTDSGRPFFVMELVQGVPITKFCDKNKLTIRERIDLLIPVCQAIQSAHQKGIIHRDIKPSNILVTLHHGEPMAKVIDFGVAKATNQKLTEKTLFTHFATMVGTPAYMSPEQAEMSSMDVDTRTDVYSLGVLFYELLTGTTPFDARELMSQGYGEMQRIIAEEEPQTPSLRASTMADETKTAVAGRRRIGVRAWEAALKGDLDWITMKCLEKDRRRRYDTPNELIADLKRHINNEPVSAVAPTLAYQFQKFYRRNRTLVRAAVAVGLILILATAFSVGMAIRMSHLRNQALVSEKKARTQTEIAEGISRFFIDDLLEQANPYFGSEPDIKLRTVVDRAAEAMDEKVVDQPLVEAPIRLALHDIYGWLNDRETATRHLNKACEIYERVLGPTHPDTLNARLSRLDDLLIVRSGTPEERRHAAEVATESYSITKDALGKEHKVTLRAMRLLYEVLSQAGRTKEAMALLEEAIPLHEHVLGKNDPETIYLLSGLSWIYISRIEYDKALNTAREAVKRSESLPPRHSARFLAKRALAGIVDQDERWRLLQENYEDSRRVFGATDPHTITPLKDYAQTVVSKEKRLNLLEEAFGLAKNHWGTQASGTLSIQNALARAYWENNEPKKAEELLLSASHLMPDDEVHVETLRYLGQFYHEQRDYDKAEAYLLEARDLARDHLGKSHLEYSFVLMRLGFLYRDQKMSNKEFEVAQELYRTARKNRGLRDRDATIFLARYRWFLLQESDRAGEADALLREHIQAFVEIPPQSDREWQSVLRLVNEIDGSEDRQPFLDAFQKTFAKLPESLYGIQAAALFYYLTGDYEACHQAYQAATGKDPGDHWLWYERSAAAIKIGDKEDQLKCSREMLARFGDEADNEGIQNRVLITFFLIPFNWTAEELARIEKVYDRHENLAEKGTPVRQVWDGGALALADYRLDRFKRGLTQIEKYVSPNENVQGISRAQALAIAALCHAGLGDFESAEEALRLSDEAFENGSPSQYMPHDISRRNYLYQEAKQLIQTKTQGKSTSDATP